MTKYREILRLLSLKEAEDENKYFKVLKEYVNPRVLILDEWLLNPITNEEARYVLDLIHKRRKKSSTIFCSQYENTEWYVQFDRDAHWEKSMAFVPMNGSNR